MVLGPAFAAGQLPQGAGADAAGEQLTLSGGQFLSPAFTKMIKDDAGGATPTSLFFSGETVDSGISDFVGSGPNAFTADVALSERPLTTAEVATATANGRSIAYVPFAATPIAIVTLVPNSTYDGSSPTIVSSNFCQHIPLSVDQLGGLFGYDATQAYTWGDPRIPCSSTEGLASYPVTRWANLDPTMENQSMMALLDSEPTSKGELDAGLQQAQSQNAATTTVDTPSEHWPYSANTYPQGDQSLIEHMVNIDPRSNVPSTDSSFWHLGAIAPVSSEWTGAPLGAQWNFPTAAVENAASADVPPSVAAAQAAENSITLAADNTVTFNPNPQDATAYNSFLMLEDYLVVPTGGLDAAKDKALAQFIRFALGTTGAADLETYGSAPATPAMVTAGLKVAAGLDQAAVVAAAASSSTTTTTSTTGGAAAGPATATGTAASATSGAGADGSGSSTGTSSGLAFTGAGAIWPLVGLGAFLASMGAGLRLKFRRRTLLAGGDDGILRSRVLEKDGT